MKWQFIKTGFQSGSFNMEFDLHLAEQLLQGEIDPTLRIYGWKPWAVSLGYHQSHNDINTDKCREYGFDIVRRPTGGRAILHANEVTYSVVMPANEKSVTEIYSLISRALVAGLKKICPEVAYESAQPNFQSLYKHEESIPCFSSSARYEVQVQGRKLVGSAQKRFSTGEKEIVLQHGSILLGKEHQLLTELLNLTKKELKEKIDDDFEKKTIDLSTAAQRIVTFDDAGDAIRTGFQQELDIDFEHKVKEVS